MRSSTLDAARRGYLGLTRGVVMSTDDTTAVQTVNVRGLHGEMLESVERFQQYGFNSVPVDPTQNGAQGAEPLVGFVNGNRSHPVVLAENDRRTRPTRWQQGESGLWHYQGASAKFTQTGWLQDAGPNKQPHTWTCGSGTLSIGGRQVPGAGRRQKRSGRGGQEQRGVPWW